MPFLLDYKNKTPLHYLIASPNLDLHSINFMLDYIADYLEDKQNHSYYEIEQIHSSLSPLFRFIVSRVSLKTKDRYLKLCCQPSAPFGGLPEFGKFETHHIFSKTPVVQPEVRKLIHRPGQDRVVFKSLLIHSDYDINSENMFYNVLVLSSLRAEDIFRTPIIAKMIDNLWESARFPIIMMSLFFSALMTLFSVYIGLGERILPIEIILVCFAVVALIGEGLQFYVLRRRYFSSVFNLIDALNSTLIIIYLAMRMVDNKNDLAQGWICSIVILIGYLRWILYLRFFKTTSNSYTLALIYYSLGNLIETIISILRDMYGFIIVLLFIFIGFALISLEFNRGEIEYGDQLYDTFKVLFGQFDDTTFNVSQKLFTALILFILNVVLLNLLISIMGDSYDKVQERRVLTDSLTRLDMILEAMVYLRILNQQKKSKGNGYLIYCEPEEEENEEDATANEWEGRINLIKKNNEAE